VYDLIPRPGCEVILRSGTEVTPAPIVTFVWPQGPRTGIMATEWREGWSIKSYLHSPDLRQYPLLGLWQRCRRFNAKRERVKLLYVPEPGDTIVLSLNRRIA
jgi:hypothetical protein